MSGHTDTLGALVSQNVLDEVIDGLGVLLRALEDGACDAINLKISKVGGLTRARQIRDLCVATVDDATVLSTRLYDRTDGRVGAFVGEGTAILTRLALAPRATHDTARTLDDATALDDVLAAVDKHRDWMERSGELDLRRRRRVRDEIEAIAVTALRHRFGDLHGDARLDTLAEKVLAGQYDPYAAADEIIAAL